MRRREFIALMGASVAWPSAALAQEPGRTYRLGGVSTSPRSAPHFCGGCSTNFGGLTSSRAKTSRSNGVVMEHAFELIPEYAAGLVKASVDVLFGGPDSAAQQATKSIPILGIAEDMVGSGIGELVGAARRQYNRRQRPRDRARRQTTGDSDRSGARASSHGGPIRFQWRPDAKLTAAGPPAHAT